MALIIIMLCSVGGLWCRVAIFLRPLTSLCGPRPLSTSCCTLPIRSGPSTSAINILRYTIIWSIHRSLCLCRPRRSSFLISSYLIAAPPEVDDGVSAVLQRRRHAGHTNVEEHQLREEQLRGRSKFSDFLLAVIVLVFRYHVVSSVCVFTFVFQSSQRSPNNTYHDRADKLRSAAADTDAQLERRRKVSERERKREKERENEKSVNHYHPCRSCVRVWCYSVIVCMHYSCCVAGLFPSGKGCSEAARGLSVSSEHSQKGSLPLANVGEDWSAEPFTQHFHAFVFFLRF